MGYFNNVIQRHSRSSRPADFLDELGNTAVYKEVVGYGLVRSTRANQKRPFFELSYSAVPSDLENSHADTIDRQSRSLLGFHRPGVDSATKLPCTTFFRCKDLDLRNLIRLLLGHVILVSGVSEQVLIAPFHLNPSVSLPYIRPAPQRSIGA